MAKMQSKSEPRRWFEIRAAGEEEKAVEILIYGAIGKSWMDDEAMSASAFTKEFNAALKGRPAKIVVRINSIGGDVMDAVTIHGNLSKHRDKVTTVIDGWALSAASVIAAAGGRVEMNSAGMMMIHNPTTVAIGDAEGLRKNAETLDKVRGTLAEIYSSRTGKPIDEIEAAMDSETWFTANEAKDWGLVDEVVGGAPILNSADTEADRAVMARYRRVPEIEPQRARRGMEDGDGIKSEKGGKSENGNRREAGDEIDKVEVENQERMKGGQSMAGEKTKEMDVGQGPVAASYQELKDALPGAGSGVICAQMDRKATVDEARKAYMAEQDARVKAAEEKAVKAQADAEASRAAPGVKPLGDGGGGKAEGSGDAIERWDTAIAANRAKGMSQAAAVREVVKNDPNLHSEYVAVYNCARKNRMAGAVAR